METTMQNQPNRLFYVFISLQTYSESDTPKELVNAAWLSVEGQKEIG